LELEAAGPAGAVLLGQSPGAEIDWDRARAVASESYRALFPDSSINPAYRDFFLSAAAVGCQLGCERLIVDAAKITRVARPRNPYRYVRGVFATKLAILAGAEETARWAILERALAAIAIPDALRRPRNRSP
jgi:hypothetical protein